MTDFPEILTNEKINERNVDFRNALFSLNKKIINESNIVHLIRIYTKTKHIELRNRILKLLYDFDFPELNDFFSLAYKKERYLDMKLYALRGISLFATEKEIDKILQKFNLTLAKRQKSTPYNYQEYEILRGKHALPFLVEKYGYSCFVGTLNQVNNQYDQMPDAFKGHFTTDENGEIVNLRTSDKSREMMSDFFSKMRSGK
jgi:hypothetical protein